MAKAALMGERDVVGRRRNTPGFGHVKANGGLPVPCPRCDGTGKINPDEISIGDRFRACRSKLGLTQAEMAARIGISRSRWANIETSGGQPGLELLAKTADLLCVSTDYLLGREHPNVALYTQDAEEAGTAQERRLNVG